VLFLGFVGVNRRTAGSVLESNRTKGRKVLADRLWFVGRPLRRIISIIVSGNSLLLGVWDSSTASFGPVCNNRYVSSSVFRDCPSCRSGDRGHSPTNTEDAKPFKTTSPLSYILQAAMGQCSTLPAEARASSSVASTRIDATYQDNSESRQEQKYRLKEDGRKESLDFNKLLSAEQLVQHETTKTYAMKQIQSPTAKKDPPIPEAQQPQSRDPEQPVDDSEPEPMDIDYREEAPMNFPQPPEIAIRTRCYKLNLDSNVMSLPSSQKQHLWLGPFVDQPPPLTYSSSEDSSLDACATTVAIRTAQIFRGITVSRDGTILTQNARATRSNRGNKTKRGEKSRQAAKIDKANDLVEESILSGKAPDSDEPAHMVSLVIVGEYDDMKHLVRDGAKKLRDASELPDEALVSINRPRANSRPKATPSAPKELSSNLASKKRVSSPSLVNSQRIAALQAPEKIQVTAITASAVASAAPPQATTPSTSPPKLKSHPRDNRPGRREDRAGMRMRLDACHPGVAAAGDGDWSHAWNLWNCGGTGTVSPLQPSSPREGAVVAKTVFEGRESAFGTVREGGVTNRT
jgi:hypothetical protein